MKQKCVLPLTWLSSPRGVSLCTFKYCKIQKAFQNVKQKQKCLVLVFQIWCADPPALVNLSNLATEGQSLRIVNVTVVFHISEKGICLD